MRAGVTLILIVVAAVISSAHSTVSLAKGVRAILVSGAPIDGHRVIAEYDAATGLYGALFNAIHVPTAFSKYDLKTRPCVAVHVIFERYNHPVATEQLSPLITHLTWWFFPAYDGKPAALYGHALPAELADRIYRYDAAADGLKPCPEAAKW